MTALARPPTHSLEQFYASKRLSGPGPEAIERELRLLAGFHVHKDVVVFLLRRLALPVQIRRVVCRQLDAGPSRKNRVLFRTATTQHQVFDAVDVVYLGRMNMPSAGGLPGGGEPSTSLSCCVGKLISTIESRSLTLFSVNLYTARMNTAPNANSPMKINAIATPYSGVIRTTSPNPATGSNSLLHR